MRGEHTIADRVHVVGGDGGALAPYDVTQIVEQPALHVERLGERIDWKSREVRDCCRHDRAGGEGARLKAIPVPSSAGIERFDMTFLINALPVDARAGDKIGGGNSLPTWRKLPGAAMTIPA
jgi:hypothetical protein